MEAALAALVSILGDGACHGVPDHHKYEVEHRGVENRLENLTRLMPRPDFSTADCKRLVELDLSERGQGAHDRGSGRLRDMDEKYALRIQAKIGHGRKFWFEWVLRQSLLEETGSRLVPKRTLDEPWGWAKIR